MEGRKQSIARTQVIRPSLYSWEDDEPQDHNSGKGCRKLVRCLLFNIGSKTRVFRWASHTNRLPTKDG